MDCGGEIVDGCLEVIDNALVLGVGGAVVMGWCRSWIRGWSVWNGDRGERGVAHYEFWMLGYVLCR